jgi:very-short-patch-repair endonuclease
VNKGFGAEYERLRAKQAGVLTLASAVRCVGRSAVRSRLASGRWRLVAVRVLVTQSGPLTDEQQLWASVLAAGQGAALAGLTAARLDGLAGFSDRQVHVLIPGSRLVRQPPSGTVVRRSALLGAEDVHPSRLPPRTRLARSLVDAASWAATDRVGRAILAAGVQQRLVTPAQLTEVLQRCQRVPRRALMRTTLADVAGGAEALSELDFCDLVRRFGLPEPDRQFRREDSQGRRWLDAVWERARLVVEIDGRWHMDARAWWADMQRDNELTIDGYRVLRFPAFAVRDNPETVARQIATALRQGREASPRPPAGSSDRITVKPGR